MSCLLVRVATPAGPATVAVAADGGPADVAARALAAVGENER
jgi:hypothetical protein